MNHVRKVDVFEACNRMTGEEMNTEFSIYEDLENITVILPLIHLPRR